MPTVKGFEDVPEPSDEDLAEIEEEFDEDADFTGVPMPERSAEYEANQREYESCKHAPDDDDDSPRARMHRNARDLTRIEHDTNWAAISKAGSFLTPREHRRKERDR